jgi:chemotaxis protein methyltransferase CheR
MPNPDAWSLYMAAKTAADQLQLETARRSVELALQRVPLLAPAHYLHGLILEEAGQLEPAVAALRRCVYADPSFVLGHFALANLFSVLGQPERARVHRANVARLLQDRKPEDLIPEGDGLTAGRLLELLSSIATSAEGSRDGLSV